MFRSLQGSSAESLYYLKLCLPLDGYGLVPLTDVTGWVGLPPDGRLESNPSGAHQEQTSPRVRDDDEVFRDFPSERRITQPVEDSSYTHLKREFAGLLGELMGSSTDRDVRMDKVGITNT